MLNFTPALSEVYNPGQAITATTSEPLQRGQFVAIDPSFSGSEICVQVCPAGQRPFGLATLDADAGAKVLVQRGNSRCFRIPTGGALNPGDEVEVGPAGAPVLHDSGHVVGQVLRASDGETVEVSLV